MNIPRDAIISHTLEPGATYLLEIDGIPLQHYFVVLNYNPVTDEAIVLVNATTQHTSEAYHIVRTKLPYDTLVYIPQGQSSILPQASTFNCNVYQAFTKDEMENNPKIRSMTYIGIMEADILNRLRAGFLASPRVRSKHKTVIEDGSTES